MHHSWKVKGHFGYNFVLFIEGVVDFIVDEVDVELDELVWNFRRVVIGNELRDDFEG
jgi:hypothetical protein